MGSIAKRGTTGIVPTSSSALAPAFPPSQLVTRGPRAGTALPCPPGCLASGRSLWILSPARRCLEDRRPNTSCSACTIHVPIELFTSVAQPVELRADFESSAFPPGAPQGICPSSRNGFRLKQGVRSTPLIHRRADRSQSAELEDKCGTGESFRLSNQAVKLTTHDLAWLEVRRVRAHQCMGRPWS